MYNADTFLELLNKKYAVVHRKYQSYFCVSFMRDRSVNERKDEALHQLNEFRGSAKMKAQAVLPLK